MICKNCGASLPDDSKTCIFCGAAIDTETVEKNAAANTGSTQESSYTVVTDVINSAAASVVPDTQQPAYSVVNEADASADAKAGTGAAPDLSLLTQQEASSADAEEDIPDEITDENAPATEAEQKQADAAAASKGTKPRTVGLIALIEVIVLAAAVFVFYQFRTDTIHSVTAETLSINSVSVTVDSRNGKDLQVICSTDAGEVERAAVTDSVAVFTDLEPNTAYTFEPVSATGKLLLSNTSATATTNQQTTLNGIAVTSYSATSATFSISGTGAVPDSWLITLTADDGTVTTETVTDTEFTFEDLTPQTTYTVTVERGDGEPVSGDNTCDFTTQGYTTLSDFAKMSSGGDTISLAWSYSGTIPDSWTISCVASDGSSTEAAANGTEYTLSGLIPDVYTVTLSCSSLEPTDLNTLTILLPGENIFTDVTADSYCYAPVLWAYYSGVAAGTEENLFSPEETCTRAQVVTFLWRLAGEPAPAGSTSPFTDVTDPNDPTYDAIMWAVENGIAAGTSDTTFSPDETVTRGQVVTFLWRYAGEPAPAATESSFTDVSNSDAMFQPIMWAVERGITAGTSDTEFSSEEGCTRGQVVTFLYRYLGVQ